VYTNGVEQRFDRAKATTGGLSAQEAERRGALVLRTLPLVLIPLGVTLITFLILRLFGGLPHPPANQAPPGAPLVPIVLLIIFFSALIILVRVGRPTISALLLIAAWTLVTTFSLLKFGVTSYTPALLIVPICAAGLLIDRVAALSLAALATLLVGVVAWLQARGLTFPQEVAPPFAHGVLPFVAFGFWLALFWVVALLTSMLAGGLQQALRRSSAQADELRQLSGQLEARVAEQTARLLAQERAAATLEERARLAREIHDGLAQGLAGISVQLGAAQRALAAAPEAAAGHIAEAQRLARESLAEARRSVWNLRAPALERGTLADALRGLAERQNHSGLAASFELRGAPRPLPPAAEAALLRVCQEALANVARHAGAVHVRVMLAYGPDEVRLVIQDDGVGFDSDALAAAPDGPSNGFGLLGMRERLTALGGALILRNADGATVEAVVPLREA
jgi:signal transduction histidine kinase